MFIDTLPILDGVKARLVALKLADAVTPAFDRVEVYSQEDFVQALADLRVFKKRVAFVVAAGDDYETSQEGGFAISKRSTEIVVLLGDRDYGKAESANTGGERATGVLVLKDLVVNDLTGAKLGLPDVVLTPVSGEQLRLTTQEQAEQAGRRCWAQSFRTAAGEMAITLHRRRSVR